jgi:hypothetical protein
VEQTDDSQTPRWPNSHPGRVAFLHHTPRLDRLDRRLPFHARAELRHAEIAARLEPDRAEQLLELARRRQSPKYQALALARLGQTDEAVRVALPTRSNLLLAEVAAPGQARAALDRVTRSLPSELRTGFATASRLARQLQARA